MPLLLRTRAAMRQLTLFPLLGPVSLRAIPDFDAPAVRVVIAGGEPQRPPRPEWFSALAAECARHSLRAVGRDRGRGMTGVEADDLPPREPDAEQFERLQAHVKALDLVVRGLFAG